MKNIFKTILFAAALMVVSTASANSYLYWMIDTYNEYGDWDYARIQVVQNGTKIGNFLTFGDTPYSEIGTSPANTIGANYANLGSFVGDNYSYILELYSDSTGWVAENKNAITYNALLAADAIYNGGGSGSTAFDFSGTEFTNVPEPTSGLLVVLGCALIGLRRRRI